MFPCSGCNTKRNPTCLTVSTSHGNIEAATVKRWAQAGNFVRQTKTDASLELAFRVHSYERSAFVAASGASRGRHRGNDQGGRVRRQVAFVVLFCSHRLAQEGESGSLSMVDWKPRRIKRVALRSLAKEILAPAALAVTNEAVKHMRMPAKHLAARS